MTPRRKGRWGGGLGGGMGIERDFAWDNEGTMQCADNVLLSHTLDTCTPISSINKKRKWERK